MKSFFLHWQNTILFIFMFSLILLPRGVMLDHFVTDDEPKWLVRSGNFYQALSQGNWANTFQREHPGVTIMWTAMAGFLSYYPNYAYDVSGQLEWEELQIEPFLRRQGYDPIALLANTRFFVVLVITSVLTLAFLSTKRLLGTLPALVGFGLIATDPFHIALSRLLHLDGLLSSLMLLSLLMFLNYLYGGRKRRYLIFSAIGGGLAWLTKSPSLFLIPFIGLLLLLELMPKIGHHDDLLATIGVNFNCTTLEKLRRVIWLMMVWTGLAVTIFILLWPAVWVEPLTVPLYMFSESTTYATGDHLSQLYFKGEAYKADPGVTFYPLTFLWRTTPIVLFGLCLALVAFILRKKPLDNWRRRRTILILGLFVVLYILLITLGTKKLPRYGLPVYLPIDIIAATGWIAATSWLVERTLKQASSMVFLVLLLPLAQAFHILPISPYYFTYYNPLLGGVAEAPKVMMIGRGEGYDEAARYLNAKPNVEQLQIWTKNQDLISYVLKAPMRSVYFDRTIKDLQRWLKLDYAVLYVGDWQRELLLPELATYFEHLTPEKVIYIDGLEYARIYDLKQALPPEFMAVGQPHFTVWGETIRLAAYELPSEPLKLNTSHLMTFYLQNMARLEDNLSVLVRLIGPQGEVWRDEGWPFGSPTSIWKPGDVWRDGHELTLPANIPSGYYRLELSFYESTTLDTLPATNPRTGKSIGDALVVDYLAVGELPTMPTDPLSPPARLGSSIRLLGSSINATQMQAPSHILSVRLFWQAERAVERDYTVFVHLVGPDGQIIAQQDQQPLGGFFLTRFWRTGQIVADDYELKIPSNTPSGEYELRVGMYDFATGQRLPVIRDGQDSDDYVIIQRVIVK